MRTAVGVAAVVVLIAGTFTGFVAGLRYTGESTRAAVTMAAALYGGMSVIVGLIFLAGWGFGGL